MHERNRLAREQDPSRLPELLDKIQESGADALAEMRGLVSELRPRRVAGDGLVPTLRQRFALRERREQLRVIQESLNNAVKHAGVGEAEVSLTFGERQALLRVRDAGRGFDPAAACGSDGAGGFGLASMRERVESRGLSNKEIAAELFIAEKTAKTHISSILSKLGLADRTQAAVFAVKHGDE